VFAGSVALVDNVGPSYISDNVIRGALVCTGNDPAPVASSTRIRGGAIGQCAPAAAAAAKAAPASGEAQSRRTQLLARITSRTGAGRTAATGAGTTLTTGPAT
jgi:hypothetical protein